MYFLIKLIAMILSFLLIFIHKKEKNTKTKITFFVIAVLFAALSLLDIIAVYHDRDYPGIEIMGFKDMIKELLFSPL